MQYAGRGLVHRLPWPGDSAPRAVVPGSVLEPSARVRAHEHKRKRESSGNGSILGVDMVPSGGAGQCHHTDGASNGDSLNHVEVDHRVSSKLPISKKDRKEENGSALTESDRGEISRPDSHGSTDGQERLVANRCQCPCFCGRGQHAGIPGTVGGGGTASGRVAHVGSSSADLSRVEQLVGGEAMIRGCALGVGFVTRATELSPAFLPVSEALDLLDAAVVAKPDDVGGGGDGSSVGDGGGLRALLIGTRAGAVAICREEEQRQAAEVSAVSGGPLVALPRRFEVAAALHRIRGVRFRSTA